MKNRSWLAILILGLVSSTAFAESSLTCILYEGVYTQKIPVRMHVSNDPVGTSLRFYGGDQHNNVSFIWGIDIGASVSNDSQNRFQIFASSNSKPITHAEMDYRKGIDLAVYVAEANVSVHCKETQ